MRGIYAVVIAGNDRHRWLAVGWFLVSVGAGFVGSKLLISLCGHVLQVHIVAAASASPHSLSMLWQSVFATGKSFVDLYAGAADAGKLREVVNLLFLVVGGISFVYAASRRLLPKRLTLLVVSVIAVDSVVYIASGQALQGDTSRYLIMTAPVVVLGFGSVAKFRPARHSRPYVALGLIGVLGMGILNLGSLGAALLAHWDTTFPQDAHLASVQHYMRTSPLTAIYASTDTAVPVLYLYNPAPGRLLPVGCLNGSLTRTYYSMDPAFAKAREQPARQVALIFDGTTLSNTPSICTSLSINRQMGNPERVEHTDDGSLVYIYRQAALHLLN
jgi:hypothetical protein